jgi:hypothetical protein
LLPASPRRRRRFAWAAASLVGLGLVAALVVLFPNTGDHAPERFSTAPPKVYARPRSVPYSGARRAAAEAVVRGFVQTAVLRQHVERSWPLVAPELRDGITLAQWRTGAIPVVPYDAASLADVREHLDYSYPDEVSLDLFFVPKPNASSDAAVFTIRLRAVGPAAHRRWLVASWAPAGTGSPKTPGGAAGPDFSAGSRLGAIWLLVPIGLFGVFVLALVSVHAGRGIRDRRRSRRIRREQLELDFDAISRDLDAGPGR